MKTTSYEISKKLKEIGFEIVTEKIWVEMNVRRSSPRTVECINEDEYYRLLELHRYEEKFKPLKLCYAYDLETILDALPSRLIISRRNSSTSRQLRLYSDSIRYGESSHVIKKTKDDQSLADTAARLLIKLVEEGIINLTQT